MLWWKMSFGKRGQQALCVDVVGCGRIEVGSGPDLMVWESNSAAETGLFAVG